MTWWHDKGKRQVLTVFIRHRYWFQQGNNVFASLPWPPIEKAAIVAATVKYLFGSNIPDIWIGSAFIVYCVWRFMSRWMIGWFWHRNNGYDLETVWNRGKVPPSRVEIINPEAVAHAVRMELRNDEIRLNTPWDSAR
jgi:hypothetical protein